MDIDFVSPSPGNPDEPTLTSNDDTFNHSRSATEFKLRDNIGANDSSASLKLKRNKGKLGAAIRFVNDILGGLDDYIGTGPLYAHEEEPLPVLDVYAVNNNGEITGRDPESGELINEIEGAEIGGTPTSPVISAPLETDVEFVVSSKRLENELEHRGITLTEDIVCEQTVIIDRDKPIENRDGLPFLSGRTRIQNEKTIQEGTTSLYHADVEIQPDVLNTTSNGQFVTVEIGLNKEEMVEEVDVASIFMANVQAVHDQSYGFVSNPPVTQRGGKYYLKVKFPRAELISALNPGVSTPQVVGSVGDSVFRGSGEIELINLESGNNLNSNNGNNGRNRK